MHARRHVLAHVVRHRSEGDQIVENPIQAALHRVCLDVAEELVLLGATITVMASEGAEASVAHSSEDARRVAGLAFASGEGPSADSFTSGRPVLVPDLAASDGRWVGFTPAALQAGVSGVYAFPLGLGAAPLGVLTCYCTAGASLTAPQLQRCLLAADTATSLLLTPGRRVASATDPVHADPDAQASLHIRTEVYQAQGMLTVALGISLRDAMARLRAIAYTEDIDLNDLAADLVAGRRDFPEQDIE